MVLAAATASPSPSWQWWVAIPSIMLIDIVLAGDNAVLIALAVRQLAPAQRLVGTALGAGAAVVLRVALTFFAARLLAINYVQLVGGLLVLWIAVKLIGAGDDGEAGQTNGKIATSLWSTVRLIVIADLSMSIDNVLAVAAASRGNVLLLMFGLALSIPIVMFASNALARLMDRYAFIAWLGAALLGKVGAEMILEDHLFFPDPTRHPGPWLIHGIGLAGALVVVLAGWSLRTLRRNRQARSVSVPIRPRS